MPLNHYSEVQQFINNILAQNTGQTGNKENQDVAMAPHLDFWNSMSYQDFITKDVPNSPDPITGLPMKILVVGNSAQSNLIQALRGTPGTTFDPNNANGIGRMPGDGPTWFTDAQINEIAAWIDAGCLSNTDHSAGNLIANTLPVISAAH